jgi:hypothetical protein
MFWGWSQGDGPICMPVLGMFCVTSEESESWDEEAVGVGVV